MAEKMRPMARNPASSRDHTVHNWIWLFAADEKLRGCIVWCQAAADHLAQPFALLRGKL